MAPEAGAKPPRGAAAEQEAAEAAEAFQKLVRALAREGYPRCSLAELSEFDRIVGGLCWLLESVGAGAGLQEVDLFFSENSTVGQRIKLSEHIVDTLRRLGCPAPLQAHQIQGNDFPALHPVVDWLVARLREYRRVHASELRRFAEFEYQRALGSSATLLADDRAPAAPALLPQIARRYRPERRYRRSGDLVAGLQSEDDRVRSCLLEYGDRVSGRSLSFAVAASPGEGSVVSGSASGLGSPAGESGSGDKFDAQYAAVLARARKEEQARLAKAKELEHQHADRMVAETRSAADATASRRRLTNLVELESDAIRSAASAYRDSDLRQERGDHGSGEAGSVGGSAAARQQVAAASKARQQLQANLAEAKTELAAMQAKAQSLAKEVEDAKAALVEVASYHASLEAELEKLTESAALDAASASSGAELGQLAELRDLVQRNETLRAKEKQFKADCKAQLSELQATLHARKQRLGNDPQLAEIERVYDHVYAKHAKLRVALAEQSQQVALASRAVDDVPTREELIQYERRFGELYDEVALKLEENRKHVTTYNTLETVLKLLEKEVSLIQSVHDQFEVGMRSAKGKREFQTQFGSILESVRTNLVQMRKKRDGASAERDAKQEEYQRLLLRQRKYLKTVKELQEECSLNEDLLRQLEATPR